jgi:hypothetical protein
VNVSDELRREVFNRQSGICLICNEYLSGPFILHHIKNRKNGGPTVYHNLEARHAHCEIYAHKMFKDGNPNGVTYHEHFKPIKIPKKPKKLKGDKRPIDEYRLVMNELYAFKIYCQGEFECQRRLHQRR